MRNRTGWIFSLAGVVIFCGHARPRAQVVDKPQEDSKAVKAMVEDSVGWYQVFSDASAPEATAPLRFALAERHTRDARIGRCVRFVGPPGAARGFGKHLPL